MGAAASDLPELIEVDPGDEAVTSLRVVNRGTVIDEFTFRVLGEPAAWTVVDPPTLSLFPRADGEVQVRFKPPRGAHMQPGVVPFGLAIDSVEDPGDLLIAEGSLLVRPFREHGAELMPQTSIRRRSARHRVILDNFGNVGVDFALSGADKDDKLEFRFKPPAVRVAPGRAEMVDVRVRPRRPILYGQSHVHAFAIRAHDGGPEPLLLDGVMIQKPYVPRWLMTLGLMLVVLLVLAFALFRPQIKSTAEAASPAQALQQSANAQRKAASAAAQAEAAQSVAAQASKQASAAEASAQQAGTAAQKAGATAESADSKADANAKRTAALERHVSASPGTPVSQRLEVKCPNSCSAALSGQRDRTLSVTDVVLENPSKSKGTVVLGRNGIPLLVDRLDSVGSRRFSFAAPIVVGANDRLTLRCSNGAHGACSAGAYLAGFAGKAPLAGPPTAPGTPSSQRLDVSCPARCTAVLPRAKGQLLSVTDVVLENPAKTVGTLVLARNGEPLLVEPLDALGDGSFSFAAPIVIGPNDRLTLRCSSGASRPCAAGAYVGGFTTRASEG